MSPNITLILYQAINCHFSWNYERETITDPTALVFSTEIMRLTQGENSML